MADGEQMPKLGERVTVRWPGGDYDYVIELRDLQRLPDDWLLVSGSVVEPVSQHRTCRSFQVHWVDGEFSLLPKITR